MRKLTKASSRGIDALQVPFNKNRGHFDLIFFIMIFK